jgi:hypothetical protein
MTYHSGGLNVAPTITAESAADTFVLDSALTASAPGAILQPYQDVHDVVGAQNCALDPLGFGGNGTTRNGTVISALAVQQFGNVSQGHLDGTSHYTCSVATSGTTCATNTQIAPLPLKRHKPGAFRVVLGGPAAIPYGGAGSGRVHKNTADLRKVGCDADWQTANIALLASSPYEHSLELDVTHVAGRRSSNNGSAFIVESYDTSGTQLYGSPVAEVRGAGVGGNGIENDNDLYASGAIVVAKQTGTARIRLDSALAISMARSGA